MIGVNVVRGRDARSLCKVRHDLMAVEIEVDPAVRASPFRTLEDPTVKLACGIEVMHRKSKMEYVIHNLVTLVLIV